MNDDIVMLLILYVRIHSYQGIYKKFNIYIVSKIEWVSDLTELRPAGPGQNGPDNQETPQSIRIPVCC